MNDLLDEILAAPAAKSVAQSSATGYIDDLGFLGNRVLPDNVKQAGSIRMRGNHQMADKVPSIDSGYRFKPKDVKVLQFFFSGGINRCLSLTGDTGTGKTSLIEQSCARLNWPLEPFSSHDRATMFELIGSFRLSNGNTVWEDGPLLTAMRFGSVLLIDEVNVMPAEVLTGLNRVMERFSYLIPETGELVVAHPDFRIAITGNAMNGEGRGSYAGTGKMNIAFMNRFTLGIEVDWMTKDDEALMLKTRYPKVTDNVITFLTNVAETSRLSFRGGELRMPISPRGTMAIAEKLSAFSGGLTDHDSIEIMQFQSIKPIFDMVFMWSFNNSEKSAFTDAILKIARTLGCDESLNSDDFHVPKF